MSKVKVEINVKGINELMKSEPVQEALTEAGDAVAQTASSLSGEEYAARTHLASWTAICNVYPATKEAGKDNTENNTLLRAVGQVGLPREKPWL